MGRSGSIIPLLLDTPQNIADQIQHIGANNLLRRLANLIKPKQREYQTQFSSESADTEEALNEERLEALAVYNKLAELFGRPVLEEEDKHAKFALVFMTNLIDKTANSNIEPSLFADFGVLDPNTKDTLQELFEHTEIELSPKERNKKFDFIIDVVNNRDNSALTLKEKYEILVKIATLKQDELVDYIEQRSRAEQEFIRDILQALYRLNPDYTKPPTLVATQQEEKEVLLPQVATASRDLPSPTETPKKNADTVSLSDEQKPSDAKPPIARTAPARMEDGANENTRWIPPQPKITSGGGIALNDLLKQPAQTVAKKPSKPKPKKPTTSLELELNYQGKNPKRLALVRLINKAKEKANNEINAANILEGALVFAAMNIRGDYTYKPYKASGFTVLGHSFGSSLYNAIDEHLKKRSKEEQEICLNQFLSFYNNHKELFNDLNHKEDQKLAGRIDAKIENRNPNRSRKGGG